MKLVHFADTHLGFRQYSRVSVGGMNQREEDVGVAFDHVIARTIDVRPDLVVIAGDVFHKVTPENASVIHAFEGFRRLRDALPDVEVVMVAGNHDTPRSQQHVCMLGLFRDLGFHVVDGPAQRFDFPALDCEVLGVPDNFTERPVMAPGTTRRFNVLVLHGETGGITPHAVLGHKPELTAEELHTSAWDYIALGHYHVYREVAPNCFYSGAIEYTSSNTWGELEEEHKLGLVGKCIIERDLDTKRHVRHPIPDPRTIVDLEPFTAADMTSAEIMATICAQVDAIGGVEGKVIRATVLDVPRSTSRVLDHKQINAWRRSALHIQVNVEPAESAITVVHSSGRRRRIPLTERVMDKLRDPLRVIPPDVDRDALCALGSRILEEAGEDRMTQVNEELAAGVAA